MDATNILKSLILELSFPIVSVSLYCLFEVQIRGAKATTLFDNIAKDQEKKDALPGFVCDIDTIRAVRTSTAPTRGEPELLQLPMRPDPGAQGYQLYDSARMGQIRQRQRAA
ncbi:hypothetical protein AYI68_g3364, partial [Smittium mucronatum]